MSIFKKIFFVIVLIPSLMIVAGYLHAAGDVSGLLQATADSGGYDVSKTDPAELVGNILKVFLSLLGVIFLILAFFAGYTWMTANGNEEAVKKAQDGLKNAIIGIVIVISAYAITYFIIYYMAKDYTTVGGF